MSEPSTTDLIVLHAILPRDDDMVDLLVSLACHAVFVRAEGCHIWAAWADDSYGNGFAEDWGDIVVARVRTTGKPGILFWHTCEGGIIHA